jgi:lipid-binding SYLF domain-containing protein
MRTSVLKKDSLAALQTLYADKPKAKEIGDRSKAILVFPNLVKAGFLAGVQGGDGVLIESGMITGVYNNTALSYGLQAGVQTFAEAMFLTTDAAVQYLHSSSGWSIGVGPSIVVVDAGNAKSLTTPALQSDVHAFISGQKGLMAGMGGQGQKIARLRARSDGAIAAATSSGRLTVRQAERAVQPGRNHILTMLRIMRGLTGVLALSLDCSVAAQQPIIYLAKGPKLPTTTDRHRLVPGTGEGDNWR